MCSFKVLKIFKKQNKQGKKETNQKKPDSYLQRTNWWLPEGRWVGGWVKEVKGIKNILITMSTE